MAVELKCKTCGKILPTANKDEEQVTVCTDCANVLFAATDAAFASNRPERRQDVKVPRLQPGMENPYQPYAAPQGMMDREVHSATYPVQNTVPTFGKIFNHAVAAWKANLWLMVAAWFITFCVIPFGFNFASGSVTQLVNSVGDENLAIIIGVILTVAFYILNVFLGIGFTNFNIHMLRGSTANLGLLFQGGNRLLPVLGLLILWEILPIGGVFLCYLLINLNPVAGVVGVLTIVIFFVMLFQWFWPSYYLVVDRQIPVIESLRLAKQITEGNNGNTCYVFLVSLGLLLLGAIPCGIGWLFTGPLSSGLWGTAYLMISGQFAPTFLDAKAKEDVP